MAKNATGFLVYFDEEQRRNLIQERIDGYYEPFSDALSVYDWGLSQLSIALLGFSDSTIDYIALAKKGKRVVTSKFKVEFSGLVNLQSIPIDLIESNLSERIRPYFIKTSRGTGGTIPEKTWLALIDAIRRERNHLSDEIDRLISLCRYSNYRLGGASSEILLQEREALGVALDIFSGNNQLRDRVLSEWAPQEESVSDVDNEKSTADLINLRDGHSSFIKGISQRYLQEESALQHDLFNWNGMSPTHEVGVSVFEQGSRCLEVIYANRNKLEHTLGVDLIYYKKSYELFVLVQYKLMHQEGDQMVYRPDSQLSSELARMDYFRKSFQRNIEIQSHEEFRLSEDGFMIKLVPNKGLSPASGELIKGMYLPREYMHFLLSANGPKGSQGGICITFDTAPRYLTNSQFSDGIHNGWIGTRGIQSEAIKEVIQQYYETGHALLIGYETLQSNTSFK